MPDINSDYISQKLKAHTPAPEGVFRHSAVLIPIFETERGYELLFCKRSMTLRRQPGDVCFPGGGRDGDETNLETALRETWEETGIPAENIEILGQTDYVITSYGAVITPFVGLIKNTSPDRLRINPDEVEETFLVPLSFFLNREPETSLCLYKHRGSLTTSPSSISSEAEITAGARADSPSCFTSTAIR